MKHDLRNLPAKHPDKLYIDGEWIASSGHDSVDLFDSASDERVGTFAAATIGDVERAVTAARHAFDEGEWPRISVAERAQFLRSIAAAVRRRSAEFADAWTMESGILHRIASARGAETIARLFDTYADIGENFQFVENHRASGGQEAFLIHEPVGVVAAIVPWNGPGPIAAYKCAPALIAGCTVVLKMSPEAPTAGYLLAEICEEVGLPAGVMNVLTSNREGSEALVADARIDKVSFTGSTVVGRAIASTLSQRIARYTLELGGKSPAIILEDYDIETAARTIGSGVGMLTGQVCHSITRVIVPNNRHDQMVEALAAVFAGMRVGDPYDPTTDVGPLSTARHQETVMRYVDIGRSEGAKLAFGGRRPQGLDKGYYVEPTLFADVDNRSTIGQEEIFGPVISVIRARDESDALRIANDTIYGLNASVFTHDDAKFSALARRIRSGTVAQNASRTDVGIAFGGFKQSGIGREGGIEGLRPYLEAKTVVTDRPYGCREVNVAKQ